MSGNVSRHMMNDVERGLDIETGRTPKQIYDAIGIWSPSSVRKALRQLIEEGRASFTGTHCNRLYYRVQQ